MNRVQASRVQASRVQASRVQASLVQPRCGCPSRRSAGASHNGGRFATEISMPIPAMIEEHLRLPVIGAPMSIVSTPTLVLAQCKAGVVERTGLDPDKLPDADKTKMNFGTGGNTALKAWKDIWSAGQSVSGIHEVETVAALVEKLSREYGASRAQINHSAFAG